MGNNVANDDRGSPAAWISSTGEKSYDPQGGRPSGRGLSLGSRHRCRDYRRWASVGVASTIREGNQGSPDGGGEKQERGGGSWGLIAAGGVEEGLVGIGCWS